MHRQPGKARGLQAVLGLLPEVPYRDLAAFSILGKADRSCAWPTSFAAD
jgi:hypothetical protein